MSTKKSPRLRVPKLSKVQIKAWGKKLLNFPWYPFLLAVIPILWVYDHNKAQLAAGALLWPVVNVWLAAGVLFGLIYLALKDVHKVAILLAPAIYVGMVFEPIAKRLGSPNALLLLLVLYLLIGGWLIKRSKFRWQSFSKVGLVFVGVILLFNIYNIANYNWRNRSLGDLRQRVQTIAQPKVVAKTKPDIYYIVSDRYTNQAVLASQFKFGNHKFLSFLKSQGFYVAGRAHSNYPNTTLSSASFLNMQYLPAATTVEAKSANRLTPYYDLIANNQLVGFLKAQGYAYNHIGSYWAPTIKNHLADQNLHHPRSLKFGPWWVEESRFSSIVVDRSILPTLAKVANRLFGAHTFETANPNIHRDSFLRQMEYLRQVANSKDSRPKFTFMHTLMPHPPFVFNQDGQSPDSGSSDQKYVDQMRFANSQFEQVIKQIMKNSKKQAIIVIQADEGPYPNSSGDAESKAFKGWPSATTDQLRRKTGIMNAIYVPGKPLQFYETMSPVNTWRLIFNQFFGTNLPKLPDRHYVHKNSTHPYDFYDITDRIAY